MQTKSLFQRFFGLFMLGWVLVTTITPARVWTVPTEAATEKTDDKQADKGQSAATLSEWSADVVLPSHAFIFDTQAFVWPSLTIELPLALSVAKATAEPVYRLSYFDKLFEHHIAPNAP